MWCGMMVVSFVLGLPLTILPCPHRIAPPNTVLSVPVKLLKEGEGHVVTAELKSGEVYRGLLVESEDTMNVHLSDGESPRDIREQEGMGMALASHALTAARIHIPTTTAPPIHVPPSIASHTPQ